jgi:tripartite-type tricarboxylate transporter receptor subunit TctC
MNNGTLNSIGVTGAQREKSFPLVQTFQEQGIEGMNVSYWFAILLPAGVPKEVMTKWQVELKRALQEPVVSEQLLKLGVTQSLMGAADTQKFLLQDRAIWQQIVDKAGIKPE